MTEAGSVLTAECLASLGAHRQPFGRDVTDDFIYTDPAIEMPIGVMQKHLRTRSAPLLLSGEEGIGKTTLLLALERNSGTVLRFCHLSADPTTTLRVIVETVRRHWARSPSEPARPNAELRMDEHLGIDVESETRPVLVVDDAHRLDADLLDRLFRLKQEVDQRAPLPLGLLLSARPEIRPRLNAIAARHEAVDQLVTVSVRPLNRAQTRAYIQHRLQAAGITRSLPISNTSLSAVQKSSGGIPGLINVAAVELVETMGRSRSRRIPFRMTFSGVLRVVLAIILAGALASILWIMIR